MSKFNVNNLFIINGVLALGFGLIIMFIPEFLMEMIGFSTDADGPLAFRFFGILVFGVGLLTFSVRNEPHSTARRSIILMLSFSYIVMTIFHLVFCDLSNLMLWSLILLHGAFGIIYAYFFIKNE
jgi:hypothetical protein